MYHATYFITLRCIYICSVFTTLYNTLYSAWKVLTYFITLRCISLSYLITACEGSRTPVLCLEGTENDRYPTHAYVLFFNQRDLNPHANAFDFKSNLATIST